MSSLRWSPRLLLILAFSAAMVVALGTAAAVPPAFPGAEGFGAVASGGRGRPVVYVTNLHDSGPGSLREALSGGDRTVMFKVSGTINLADRLWINDENITIAGESAPGGGICVRGADTMIRGRNIIVRFMRFRPGDERGVEQDALTIWGARDVIVDHCSLSWSTDSVSDVVKGPINITIQWSIVAEPLDRSVHHKGSHGYGTGWSYGTYHHNLIAHCASRAPRLAALPTRGITDVRNNVIYNWGFGWAYGGEDTDINLVGNYFKPGPDSEHNHCLFNVWEDTCRLFLADNVMESNQAITSNNRQGVISEGLVRDTVVTLKGVVLDHPFPVDHPVTTQSAQDAYAAVLAGAGATVPARDAADQRVVDSVRDGGGRVINSQADVGGWPELKSAPAPEDRDGDGMPNAWELDHGLDPADASDGAALAEDGYSHLEHYLHALADAAWQRSADAVEASTR